MQAKVLVVGKKELGLAELELPLALDRLVAGQGPWEVELGAGKGRFLLRRAAESPECRFLAVEVACRYAALIHHRAQRRGLSNLLTLQGEALYLISAVLPGGFARAAHVYFPDPWPKSRHNKRRLFDSETVDLVLSLLQPGGCLYFATDHLDYGGVVGEILAGYRGLHVHRCCGPWEGGPRTNYEAKYQREGRTILRLEARLLPSVPVSARQGLVGSAPLHPRGAAGILVAPRGVDPTGGPLASPVFDP